MVILGSFALRLAGQHLAVLRLTKYEATALRTVSRYMIRIALQEDKSMLAYWMYKR